VRFAEAESTRACNFALAVPRSKATWPGRDWCDGASHSAQPECVRAAPIELRIGRALRAPQAFFAPNDPARPSSVIECCFAAIEQHTNHRISSHTLAVERNENNVAESGRWQPMADSQTPSLGQSASFVGHCLASGRRSGAFREQAVSEIGGPL
jgi:hypothetical protein